MLLHIVLASEILSSLICTHCLHGKKIKLEKGTVSIVIFLFFILEAINLFQEGVINFVSLNFSYWDISAHR